jgi:hypothetical protein
VAEYRSVPKKEAEGMRRLSLFSILLPMLLPAVVAAREMGRRPIDLPDVPLVNVAGTRWAGTDSDGDYYEYHFQANGVLHYKSPSGSFDNGTWKQDRDSIYMETNQKYAEYQGRIGTLMKGKAWNVAGHKWTWEAAKQ